MTETSVTCPESEASVLGCMLLNPADACYEAVRALGETGAMFSVPAHRAVYEGMLQVLRSPKALDVVTLADALTCAGKLELAGGFRGLSALTDTVPTSANVAHYAAQVREAWRKRRLAELCDGTARAALRPDADVPVLVDGLERELFDLFEEESDTDALEATVLAPRVADRLRDEMRRGVTPGLTTGLEAVDRLLGGLKPSEVTIIAGRTSVGKSALALNIVHHVAVTCDKRVMVVSLEMSAEANMQRLMCINQRIRGEDIAPGTPYMKHGIDLLTKAEENLRVAPLCIDDRRDTDSESVRRRVRHYAARNPLALVVVDHCQELHAAGRWTSNRTEEIGQICRDIRSMAQDVKAPVLLLSQLNRVAASEEPRLHHLRSSGDLEQAADVVILLAPVQNAPETLRLGIAKHRNGPTGECFYLFDKATGCFLETKEVKDDGYPCAGDGNGNGRSQSASLGL